MLTKCSDNSCDEVHEEMMNEVDAKIESLKEYFEEEMTKEINFLLEKMLHFDDTVTKSLQAYVEKCAKKKIKKLLLYILPPLAFLLLLAMIL